MTVSRLLAEADSLELERWQHYFKAAERVEADRRESARLEREVGI